MGWGRKNGMQHSERLLCVRLAFLLALSELLVEACQWGYGYEDRSIVLAAEL